MEFKRDLSSPGPIIKTVVAFANTAGGDLVIGVNDSTRDVVGISDALGEEERLANLITDRIAPPRSYPISKSLPGGPPTS